MTNGNFTEVSNPKFIPNKTVVSLVSNSRCLLYNEGIIRKLKFGQRKQRIGFLDVQNQVFSR